MRKFLATTALVAALGLGMTATGPQPAQAQMTVIDPTAIAQAIKQVSQQLQQIQQLQAQLTNQAAMLQKLGTDVTGPLQSITSQATQLLQQAQGIGYNGSNLAQQYQQLYPANMQGMTFAQISQALANWQTNSRQTLQEAMATQNQIVQAQPATATAVKGAVSASQGAAGQTAAIQATNQLLAALSTQLTQLQTILITQGRAAQTAEAQAQAARTAGDAEHQRVFHGAPPPAIGVNNASHLLCVRSSSPCRSQQGSPWLPASPPPSSMTRPTSPATQWSGRNPWRHVGTTLAGSAGRPIASMPSRQTPTPSTSGCSTALRHPRQASTTPAISRSGEADDGHSESRRA